LCAVYDVWQRSAYRETSLETALKVSPRGACDDGLVYRFESRSTVPESASRERYFTAALEILTAQGFGHLTMTALHRRLGVSSGSFYHFFAGWDDFVAQFLESWITQTAEISVEAQQTSDPFDRLEILRLLAKSVPHAAEAAMRMWSATDATVATAQRHVDAQRLAIIAEAVSIAGVADVQADRLARHGLSLIVGWQQLSHPFDAHGLDELLGQFIDLVHGYASPP
jgi:AcrR family transcriptional regulator